MKEFKASEEYRKYLIELQFDNFNADNANIRTDEYGGSVENKSRFTLEVVKELINSIGGDKVGVRLSPSTRYNDILLNDPIAQFTHLIKELDKLHLVYIHLVRTSPMVQIPNYPKDVIEDFGRLTKHIVIANLGYDKESGEEELQRGIAKIISYGTLFLANPDLPKQFELNKSLSKPDQATMYGGGAKGYIDYPTLNQLI